MEELQKFDQHDKWDKIEKLETFEKFGKRGRLEKLGKLKNEKLEHVLQNKKFILQERKKVGKAQNGKFEKAGDGESRESRKPK